RTTPRHAGPTRGGWHPVRAGADGTSAVGGDVRAPVLAASARRTVRALRRLCRRTDAAGPVGGTGGEGRPHAQGVAPAGSPLRRLRADHAPGRRAAVWRSALRGLWHQKSSLIHPPESESGPNVRAPRGFVSNSGRRSP